MVVGKHSSGKMNAHLTVTTHAAMSCDAFPVLTAVLAAGLHCGSPHFSMLLWYYEIRTSPLPVWACGGSISTMWRLCVTCTVYFCRCFTSLSVSRCSSGVEIAAAVETDEHGESEVSNWLSWLCSHLHVSRETPASLGARAASTRCLTATPPPAQGTSAHLQCVCKKWCVSPLTRPQADLYLNFWADVPSVPFLCFKNNAFGSLRGGGGVAGTWCCSAVVFDLARIVTHTLTVMWKWNSGPNQLFSLPQAFCSFRQHWGKPLCSSDNLLTIIWSPPPLDVKL